MGRKLIHNPLYIILYLSFVLFIGLPVIYTFVRFLFIDVSFINNIKLINSDIILLLAKSCLVAASIAATSTLFGTALGFLVYKTNVKYRSFFKLSLLIPLFISPYILAVAWKDFFYLVFGSTNIISSYFGVILVLSLIFTPLSMLIIGSALSNINSQLEEAGLVITNLPKVIFKIILPLIKPALVTSFILVFIFSISEFSVPAFFGVKVFTTEIFTQFSAFYNYSLAVLQSSLLIIICVLLLFVERKQIANAPFLSVGSKGTKTKLYNLEKKSSYGLLFLFGWLIISVVFPFIILLIQSLKSGTGIITQAFELLIPTIGDSVGLAFLAALIITFVGLVAAYFSVKQINTRISNSFDWLLLVVFAIPSIIFGISLIKFYNYPALDFIYSSYAIILIAFVGKFSFIATKLIGNSIKQIPNSLDEAAQIESVKPFSRLRNILLPLIAPSLFVSFVITFIFSFSEIGTTIMLYPPGTQLMPIKVFTIMANAPQALTSSMTLIVFFITLLIITGYYYLMKFLFRSGG